jgi:hypothetical protein
MGVKKTFPERSMRTKTLFLILVLLGCVSVQRATAQQPITAIPIITDADIINATALVDPLAEKVKDIAPTSFSLNIINNTPNDTVWVTMRMIAKVTLDEDRETKIIVDGTTKNPFKVLPGGRLFTSRDADRPNSDIEFGRSPDSPLDKLVNSEMKDKLKSKVTEASSGGRVPSGVYDILIRLTVVQIGGQIRNEPIPDIVRSVNVTNPTNATLLLPSDNGFEYPSPFPQFQWSSDTRGVKITVYEKRAEHASLEDAISASDPYWVVNINRRESGNLSTITYPQGGVAGPGINRLEDDQSFGLPRPYGPRPLERGKSYVVVLDGIRTAFGYDIDFLRTIRLFRVSDPQGQMILNILQTTLSGGTYQNFLNIIQDQKLQINSSRLTLNGVTISAQELQVLLNQNKDKIKTIRFED